MAIESKVGFLNQLEQRLSAEVTADVMARTLAIVSDVLEGFDMIETFRKENDGMDDLLDSYVSAMEVSGLSQKTIDRYVYIIKRALGVINMPTRQITIYHLRNYLAKQKARGLSDITLEGERQILRGYFNWLQNEALIERNPAANLGPIKCAKKQKKAYTAIEIEKLNQSCDQIRDRALLAFLEATGCRISETLELNREGIDLKNLTCVVHGKGNVERPVYFDSVTGMILSQYLEERKDDCEALFINRYGQRLNAGGARVILNRLADRAGVDHVHPHKFRRTLATNLSRHGMPIEEIAQILGHAKLDTTMKYVVMDNETTKNSYRRFT